VIAIATCIRTNQTPNSERRRKAPPLHIRGLFPNKNGDSYNISKYLIDVFTDVTNAIKAAK
ncbi:MAG: hypothetical protein ACK56I_07095, partial [bacterium]